MEWFLPRGIVITASLISLVVHAEAIWLPVTAEGELEFAESHFGEVEFPEEPLALPVGHEGIRADRSPASSLSSSTRVGGTPSALTPKHEVRSEFGGTENSLATIAQRFSATQEMALIVGDLGFFPQTLIATADIPLRIYVTSASQKTLCIVIDDFKVQKQVQSHEIKEVMLVPKVGQYRIYCPVNHMEGKLIVKAAG